MQRLIMAFVVLAALGYIGYVEREPIMRFLPALRSLPSIPFLHHTSGSGSSSADGDAGSKSPGSGEANATPIPHQHAPPGTFYMVDRAKVTSASGVKAVSPGEQVKLLERLPGNKLRVTIDHADFVVSSWQVTDDLDVAREAERKFLAATQGAPP
jgi:hypothetical protein